MKAARFSVGLGALVALGCGASGNMPKPANTAGTGTGGGSAG